MRKTLSNGWLAAIIILVIIIADQWLKIWVKTHFYLYESYDIADWFKLTFVENPGMAFGWEIGSKLFLTLFRIVASIALIYYIFKIAPPFTISSSLAIKNPTILSADFRAT